MDTFVLKGCPYPITRSPHGYLFAQEGIDQIKSDLLVLLLTNPRERVMTPAFGTPLRGLLFEPADGLLARQAREIIIAALKQWEPRVAFTDISTAIDEESQVLKITIAFRHPENIKDIEVLTLELPVGGSSTNI